MIHDDFKSVDDGLVQIDSGMYRDEMGCQMLQLSQIHGKIHTPRRYSGG